MPASADKRTIALSLGRVAAYAAVVCAIVAIFVLCWVLRDVLLLAFGAIILAVMIRAFARPLIRHMRIRERWAVMIVVLVLAAATAGLFWLFGRQVTTQLKGLSERLPQAVEEVQTWLEGHTAGKFIIEQASALTADNSWLQNAPKFLVIGAHTIGHMFLMVFAGIYIASNPSLYLDGLVRLFPQRHRDKLHEALIDSGDALRKWLLGQLVSMTSVGTLTALGLWIVGAPLPLAVGIMAGLLEFIPVIGPVIAFVPGVLVALTEGPQVALYAAIVLIVVQQLEGSVIMPFAQRWAVELPQAYGLIAVVAFGLLFGFLGIFFGSPLAVVVMCLVQHLYVENGLERHSESAARTTTDPPA
jgi:predicted PurR-regulated permease PerM